MYTDDHAPPHFHIALRDGRKVSVDLETLTITEGKVKPREVKAALDWAREHKALLWEKWKEYAE
ncbi:MAG: DUF4160 domain-containing protein [Candidatus Riflebacteria bacterium]|nr:DUF4160 domain-containing protein [Candidatus Riflebacteria bacterium]